MRTPEQIRNLRSALLLTPVGFFANFLSDELIDKLADKIQEDINKREEHRKIYVSYTWSTKVRLKEHGDKPWSEIPWEPKSIYCPYNTIMDKCYSLLIRFPIIEAIQITDLETNCTYEFNRNKKGD